MCEPLKCSKLCWGHPLVFLFSPLVFVRPTQIFVFFKKKKKLCRRQWHIISKKCHFNPKHRQFFAIQFWWFILFLLFSFEFNHDVDFSSLHCRQVDFITTSCCFQAPRILCWDTGPPSSRLLFQFFFCCCFFFFPDQPTQNQKTHSTINEKKGGWPDAWYLNNIFCFIATCTCVPAASSRKYPYSTGFKIKFRF